MIDLIDLLIQERCDEFTKEELQDEYHAIKSSPNVRKKIESFIDENKKLPSSHGSIFIYCLGISDEKPIGRSCLYYDNSWPDIDLDFSDQKRDMVFDYVERKYGAERVARLGTVAMFKAAAAMKEAGGALDIPKWKTERALDSLIKRSSGDSRAMNTLEDTLRTTPNGMALIEEHPEVLIATAMEGHPRHNSQHAAGIVLTQEPTIEYVAIDSRTGATHCDKKDAEELNLLKVDALGLTQLSVFEDTLSMVGLPIDYLESVPLDDPAAFKVLNDHKFCGIFQFEGGALQGITNQITIDNLEDIVSITSLARPGGMSSGGTNEWVKRKNGSSPVTYAHPLFEPYLKSTNGIIAFQEQVMQIGREIGGLSWGDVSELRKAMSKSLGKEYFDKFGDRFKKGAVERGVPREVLDKVWDDLCAYGAMGFNRSHAVAYGIISYWCAWLKAHHPFEFAAATLSHEKDPGKQIKMLREMAEEGIDYVPVDKDLSTNKWTAGEVDGKRTLIGPLQVVKGIGPKLVNEVLSARARGEPMPARAEKLIAKGETEIDTLFPIRDRFKELLPDPSARNIFTPPTRIIDCQVRGYDYEVLAFAVVTKIAPRDENEEINIAKRGGKRLTGPTTSLNLWIADDSDLVFAKVPRWIYDKVGKEIVDRGRPGKAMYAIKGKVPKDFRMITVSNVRYIGDLVANEEIVIENAKN